MKLLDLLVKELPKRGGFPKGANAFGLSYDYRIVLFGDKADEFRPLRTERKRRVRNWPRRFILRLVPVQSN